MEQNVFNQLAEVTNFKPWVAPKKVFAGSRIELSRVTKCDSLFLHYHTFDIPIDFLSNHKKIEVVGPVGHSYRWLLVNKANDICACKVKIYATPAIDTTSYLTSKNPVMLH